MAVLPGEPVELAAGYLFGFWEGTALCLAGALAGTLAVVALVKTLGTRLVGLFFTREQMGSVPWLKDPTRLEAVMFAVFLIPGTPKDVLTYAAALTSCPWWKIAAITTIGRIPSVASSTLAAGFAAEGTGSSPPSRLPSPQRSQSQEARSMQEGEAGMKPIPIGRPAAQARPARMRAVCQHRQRFDCPGTRQRRKTTEAAARNRKGPRTSCISWSRHQAG
ncbi:TVP38/TMEM64 family protein [uncultured Parolsenella sp.]|uniref:TVP38/TMEM64 family protein n=1 Tax=uncultured Parolsenella sp. TaxID=2083008 RepID=UPI00345BEE0D